MDNLVIELHDSVLSQVTEVTNGLLIEFSMVFIHSSKGQPGVDPGISWAQKLKIKLSNVIKKSKLPDQYPKNIWGGFSIVNNEKDENGMPFIIAPKTPIDLKIDFNDGEILELSGICDEYEISGPKKCVETFK